MIPKTIYYCWFGKNPKNEIITKCIESWHKYCPDWDIIELNESNYDVSNIQYAQEAYNAKKWSFVSDVVRLDVLYKWGGIYLDTDVEILDKHPFDHMLMYENVLVFETMRSIASGLCLACEKESGLCKQMLHCYLETHFFFFFMITNNKMNEPVIKDMFPELLWNNQTQIIRGSLFMSSSDYGRYMKHYGNRSWCDIPNYKVSKNNWLKRKLRNPEVFDRLEKSGNRKLLSIYTFISFDFLDLGPIYYIKLYLRRKKNI